MVASESDKYDEFVPPKGVFVSDFDEATDPKKRPPPNSPKKQKPLPPWKDGVIAAWATNVYDVSGKMIEPFDPEYGMALQSIAVSAGNAWEGVAKTSPGLRRVIHQLMTTTKMSELIIAHVPLVIVVMHKHGPMRHMFDEIEVDVMADTPPNGATSHAVG